MQRPINGPILLQSNNQGAISTSKDPKHHNCTKHTLVRYKYVCQEVGKGTVTIQYLETAQMPADRLTKPLNAIKFSAFVDLIGLQMLCRSNKQSILPVTALLSTHQRGC